MGVFNLIRIISKKEGFRRCGISHSEEPKFYPDNRFTKPQLKQLQAEPMLIVDVLPDDPKKIKAVGNENNDQKENNS